MEWHSLTGRTGYLLAGFCLIPTYHLNDKEIVLIDSGLTSSDSFIRFFSSMGVRVRAVLQTHLHIDHIANNRRLYDAFGTEIIADEEEIRSVMYPDEAFANYGRSAEIVLQKYNTRFDYPMTAIPHGADCVTVDGTLFKILPLPGHTINHIGFITPDDICCPGDALISPDYLANAKMPFMVDPATAVASMKVIRDLKCTALAPAHKKIIPAADIRHVAEMNIAKESSILECICRVAKVTNDHSPEVLIPKIFEVLGIRAASESDRLVIGFTTHQRILELEKAGRI